jgi:hypothetical protein
MYEKCLSLLKRQKSKAEKLDDIQNTRKPSEFTFTKNKNRRRDGRRLDAKNQIIKSSLCHHVGFASQ